MVSLRPDREHPGAWFAVSRTDPTQDHILLDRADGITCSCPHFVHQHFCAHADALAAWKVAAWEAGAARVAPRVQEYEEQVGELQEHVFTSRFQAARLLSLPGVAPIRITLAPPRFDLGYELAGVIPNFAPNPDAYRAGRAGNFGPYRDQLSHLSPGVALDMLQIVRRQVGGRDLALLCFENILTGAQPCHRRVLAEWFLDETGLIVPELCEHHLGQVGRQEQLL